ncbi:MAG: hypothetical protein LBT94_07190 [Prevotellaceae bacterium]|nr:hypothetical protein [Prevotellaceae bacterium]
MKKALTLSLLLLANIAVLAHSAIPHHPHEGIPVIITGVCTADDEAAPDHRYCHHHTEPDDATTIEECPLEAVYVRTADSERQLDMPVCDIFLLLCAPCLTSGSVDVQADLLAAFFVQKPFVSSYYSAFVARSLGLRAPPAC